MTHAAPCALGNMSGSLGICEPIAICRNWAVDMIPQTIPLASLGAWRLLSPHSWAFASAPKGAETP